MPKVSLQNFSGRLSMNPWTRLAIPGALIVLLVFLAYLPALHGGFVWDDDSWTTKISACCATPRSALDLVPAHRPATILSALGHDVLAGLSTLEVLDDSLSRGERSAARPGRVALLAVVAPAPGAGRLAGGGHFRAASGHGRIRRLDHRTQECALAGPLPRRIAGLPALRARVWRVAGSSGKWKRPDSILPRVTCHASLFYGLAFVLFLGALLAKTTTFSLPAVILLIGWWQRGQIRWRADVLPTLPFFALALGLCAGNRLAGEEPCRRARPGFCPDFPATLPDCRPGVLVLPRQTVLAGESLLRLPALAARPRRRGGNGSIR